MRKTNMKIWLLLLMCIMLSYPVHGQCKSKSFWIAGLGEINVTNKKEYKKRIIVTYNGYRMTIKGYGWKAKTRDKLIDKEYEWSKVVKFKKKTYKISPKCRVNGGGGSPDISYKKFLKKYGRKGRWDFFPEIKIRNGKVVEMLVGN